MNCLSKSHAVLDAINWDRESLDDVFEDLKFWSTFVDLLVNISVLLDLKSIKKRQKSLKNSTFCHIWAIYRALNRFRRYNPNQRFTIRTAHLNVVFADGHTLTNTKRRRNAMQSYVLRLTFIRSGNHKHWMRWNS